MPTTTDPIAVLADLVEGLALPDGVRADVIHTVTAATRGAVAVVALSGRATRTCPGCGQSDRPAARSCPVTLDPSFGEVQAWSQQHGCGTWWGPPWETVAVNLYDLVDEGDYAYGDTVARGAREALAEAVAEKAEMLAEQVRQRDADAVVALTARLRAYLSYAMQRLVEGYDVDATGTEVEPGVWLNGAEWEAWDHHPTSEDPTDTIVVTVDDLDHAEEIRAAIAAKG